MTISAATIKALPIGDRAYDDLDYCWSEWEDALRDVLVDLPGPTDDDATLNWFIAFVGNMAWAATVFFPPAALVGVAAAGEARATVQIAQGASRATEVVSLLGAAAGSGAYPKFQQILQSGSAPPALNSPEGKAMLRRLIGERTTKAKGEYRDAISAWAQTDLVSHMIAVAEKKYAEKAPKQPLTDSQFADYFNGNDGLQGPVERRRFVWENFVFLNQSSTYDQGGQGLYDFLFPQIQGVVNSYNQQWREYKRKQAEHSARARRVYHGESFGDPYPLPPFEPKIHFVGLPGDLQAVIRAAMFHTYRWIKANYADKIFGS